MNDINFKVLQKMSLPETGWVNASNLYKDTNNIPPIAQALYNLYNMGFIDRYPEISGNYHITSKGIKALTK